MISSDEIKLEYEKLDILDVMQLNEHGRIGQYYRPATLTGHLQYICEQLNQPEYGNWYLVQLNGRKVLLSEKGSIDLFQAYQDKYVEIDVLTKNYNFFVDYWMCDFVGNESNIRITDYPVIEPMIISNFDELEEFGKKPRTSTIIKLTSEFSIGGFTVTEQANILSYYTGLELVGFTFKDGLVADDYVLNVLYNKRIVFSIEQNSQTLGENWLQDYFNTNYNEISNNPGKRYVGDIYCYLVGATIDYYHMMIVSPKYINIESVSHQDIIQGTY